MSDEDLRQADNGFGDRALRRALRFGHSDRVVAGSGIGYTTTDRGRL